MRYYWENKDEGKARLARAFSFGKVKAPVPFGSELTDDGVEV